jgi:ketosteroid isomerase-like protein
MRTLLISVLMLMAMTMASAQTKENKMMTIEQLNDENQIRNLVNEFANLADMKDAKAQGELFLPDGKVEFQIGMNGQLQEIKGREPLVQAFAATINPCKAVYHINGQHVIHLNGDKATGIAYCQATLVREKNGKDIATVNSVRYADQYEKRNGKWYIAVRRTIFMITDSHEILRMQ